MKWLVAFAALFAVVAAAILLAPSMVSAASGPEPMRYGRDTCARCRMVISAPGSGGELRTPRGELRKYDDVGCLLLGLWAEHREVTDAWVEDHDGHGFVPLTAAWFVRGERDTPMGYGVTAFKDEAAARAFAAAHGGEVGPLEDVLRDTQRFALKGEQAP